MSLPCIVHLDFKGAPWRLDYLTKVITFMKDNGAKGVLIEWEDTFPFTGDLINIGSLGGCSRDGMYNMPEVQQIIQCIKDNGMVPIQLVQTIGHLEYVLKQPNYRRLRENPRSPAVLCPTRPESLTLIKNMIKQILDAQPDATYIHIGADEAWHMNLCSECQQRSESHEHGPATLYLEHINAVASYIKTVQPNVSVLMWDDMLRNTPVPVMKAYNLGELVQPVVWNYNVQEQFSMDNKMWERYSFVFPLIWAASAFKGANGSCQMLCDVQRYASNQIAWHNELTVYEEEIKFSGIILTGWSRFDHYATLCELLPVAMPSLACCLRMWTRPDGFTNETIIAPELPNYEWEGHELARYVVAARDVTARIKDYLDGDEVTTWLNPWQIAHDYTSPLLAEIVATKAKLLEGEVRNVRRGVSFSLHALTGNRSSEEWVQTFLMPHEDRILALAGRAGLRAGIPAGVTPKSNRHE